MGFAIVFFSVSIKAQGWCKLLPGDYQLITHGTKTDNVYLLGKFEGSNNSKWINIANSSVGNANITLALAGQMAGKGLSIYIDSADYDCDSYPSWSTSPIRHVKIDM